MKLKRILKYSLVFIVGFIVGFCVMYKLANDVVVVTRDYMWAESCYIHNLGVYNEYIKTSTDFIAQIMKDSINTPDGQLYKKALDRYIEVTPGDKNCYEDGNRFYLFGYR